MTEVIAELDAVAAAEAVVRNAEFAAIIEDMEAVVPGEVQTEARLTPQKKEASGGDFGLHG